MDNLVKWLLIGGVGYFIYWELTQPGGLLAGANPPPTGGTISPPGTTTVSGATTTPSGGGSAGSAGPNMAFNSTNKAKILTASGNAQALGYDAWNYYTQAVTGVYGPNWESTQAYKDSNGNRSQTMSLNQFWSYIGGMSGMGRLNESKAMQVKRSGGGQIAWERWSM